MIRFPLLKIFVFQCFDLKQKGMRIEARSKVICVYISPEKNAKKMISKYFSIEALQHQTNLKVYFLYKQSNVSFFE